jgi:hypothetical protein
VAENEKAAGQADASVHPGSRYDLIGSFAWCARHWTQISWPANGPAIDEAGTVPVCMGSEFVCEINGCGRLPQT